MSTAIVGGPSYGTDIDPTEEFDVDPNALLARMPGAIEGGNHRQAMRRGAGLLGWYVTPAGEYVRLPADPQSKEGYSYKGYEFQRSLPLSLDTPLMKDGVVIRRTTSKYEELASLVRQGLVPAEALTRMYKPVASEEISGSWRDGCSCGETFPSKFPFDVHRLECSAPTGADLKAAKKTEPENLMCFVEGCGGGPFKSAEGVLIHARRIHGDIVPPAEGAEDGVE